SLFAIRLNLITAKTPNSQWHWWPRNPPSDAPLTCCFAQDLPAKPLLLVNFSSGKLRNFALWPTLLLLAAAGGEAGLLRRLPEQIAVDRAELAHVPEAIGESDRLHR